MAAAVAVLSLFFLAREGGAPTGYVSATEAALVGQRGVALSALEPSGSVRVGEEEWTATTDPGEHVREGDEVQVVGVYAGRLLKVSSIASGPAAEPRSRLLSPLGKLWSRLTREAGRPEA